MYSNSTRFASARVAKVRPRLPSVLSSWGRLSVRVGRAGCVRRADDLVTPNLPLMLAVMVLALLLGWHLVASIGGGDMLVACRC
ncbi:hypothetical protein AB0I54_44660 [Streptomyces sp. NPDC050625]|uniref:hypothetical protein n=1 Tax=Streptomyces sp. NPDC050625 TaxID=3154629 RepID=UPI0034305187